MQSKNNPLITIVTCTYNSGRFVKKNLQSVAAQKFQDWEQIFIDGFSKDKTVHLIKLHQKQFPGKISLYSRPPKGISNAMNEGIKKAKGKYIYVLHGDDSLIDKDVLSDISLSLTKNNYPDLLYGRIKTVNEKGKLIGYFPNHWFFKISNKLILKYFNYIPHQATFVKRTVFNKFGLFDENLKYAMDPEYWLRIRLETTWKFVDRVIAVYKVHADANSSSLKNSVRNDKILNDVKLRYLNRFEYWVYRFIKKFIINPRVKRILQ